MARYVTRLRTGRPAEEVFAYMADLRNFAEWDPGVRRVAQVDGAGGGPGAVFDVTVGRRGGHTLRYRTTVYDPPRAVRVTAKTSILTSEDSMTVDVAGGATILTYDADLRFNGPLRIGDPILRAMFNRIGDRASAGLRRVLEGDPIDP